MPYCPKCKGEYRKGFTVCADCVVDLVDKLQPEEKKEPEDGLRKHPEMTSLEKEVVLETFIEPVEFMYVASMLDEMNIPYLVRTKRGDNIEKLYTLQTTVEKTIYVDDKDFERAEEVLQSLDAYLMEDFDEDEE